MFSRLKSSMSSNVDCLLVYMCRLLNKIYLLTYLLNLPKSNVHGINGDIKDLIGPPISEILFQLSFFFIKKY